jgi:hypothetical protein
MGGDFGDKGLGLVDTRCGKERANTKATCTAYWIHIDALLLSMRVRAL